MFMIAPQEDTGDLFRKIDQEIDHIGGIRTPVDVVSEKNRQIALFEVDPGHEVFELVETAMDISDSKCSLHDLVKEKKILRVKRVRGLFS